MFQIQAPILIVPTADAKLAVGVHLHAAGLAAYREIALAAKGLEIAHLQFVFRGLTLAVCSRVRRDGIVEIEIGRGAAQGVPSGRRACINILPQAPCGASADLAHAVRLHFRGRVLISQ
jgi:hypothetical protein